MNHSRTVPVIDEPSVILFSQHEHTCRFSPTLYHTLAQECLGRPVLLRISILEATVLLSDTHRQRSKRGEEADNDVWCDCASSSPGVSPCGCSFVRWRPDLRNRAQSLASTLIHPHHSEFTLTGGWIILSLSHTLTHATWFLARSGGDLHPAIFPLHTTWSQNWNSIWLHVFTLDCLLGY